MYQLTTGETLHYIKSATEIFNKFIKHSKDTY